MSKEQINSSGNFDINENSRFVFVTGSVVSGLGKGITISSIGRLLRSRGINVTCVKIDPYLNTDAGTMSPFEHGETFVLDDGGETDLDLGNYERFLDINLTKDHNITTGKIYSSVISKERRGDFLGKTVQVVPHVTNEIQQRISSISKISVVESGELPEICLVEVGGTVGDIESSVFLEAIRQFIRKVGTHRCCLVHVSLIVTLGEQKTKPTQHGVKTLMGVGLLPDIIVCRSQQPLNESVRAKISNFCHVSKENVISIHDCANIYHVPIILHNQNTDELILQSIGLEKYLEVPLKLDDWINLASNVDAATKVVKIGLVGKYTKISDSYLSVNKALKHACVAFKLRLDLIFIESSCLEDDLKGTEAYATNWNLLKSLDGVVIPGGFGDRGIKGMLCAIKYARVNKVPILGICLGLQNMVIEYCQNVLNLTSVNSAEFDADAEHKVIIEMLEHHTGVMGGTMRLGARNTIIEKNSIAYKLYHEQTIISERHRHRYEVNLDYVDQLSNAGLKFVGKDETGQRMEIIELPIEVHPFFFGVQYHPELKSRPIGKLSPPFVGLITAAAGILEETFT